MSDFNGMEELLQDFLTESGELLSDVDNKLVELEKYPEDKGLLNDIFRGFHTIKGGAGFLNATPLVTLCHRTENLFDKLRNGELQLNSHVMDVILDATGVVRDMFGDLAQSRMPACCGGRTAAVIAIMTMTIAPSAKSSRSTAGMAMIRRMCPPPVGVSQALVQRASRIALRLVIAA